MCFLFNRIVNSLIKLTKLKIIINLAMVFTVKYTFFRIHSYSYLFLFAVFVITILYRMLLVT